MNERAMYFQKSNVADLKDKLMILLQSGEMVRCYKKEAQYFICNKYNWDDVAEQTLRTYKK